MLEQTQFVGYDSPYGHQHCTFVLHETSYYRLACANILFYVMIIVKQFRRCQLEDVSPVTRHLPTNQALLTNHFRIMNVSSWLASTIPYTVLVSNGKHSYARFSQQNNHGHAWKFSKQWHVSVIGHLRCHFNAFSWGQEKTKKYLTILIAGILQFWILIML